MRSCTAVIDIGSNSARLVIYQKNSPYGFHLICERKSKVRIGEGAYEKDGYLQPVAIERAYLALKEFIATTKHYPIDKILSVATSALRDAPNGLAFTAWIKEQLGLEIAIIDGKQEAYFGGIAAKNLLPVTHGITVDIGGGSTDLTILENKNIIETYSLNLGTVRLKELFFDKNRPIEEACTFIQKELEKLPKTFKHSLVIGIGGTARTLSKAIMKKEHYPLNNIHAFEYKLSDQIEYIQGVSEANLNLLEYLYIPKGRFDTIREGALIWRELLMHISAKRVITSGVGVREGVFLNAFLKEDNFQFPTHINPSIESILGRFEVHHIATKKRVEHAQKLLTLFVKAKRVKKNYLKELLYAIRLSTIGYKFNIYKTHEHAFYVTMQELNYAVSHKELLLTAMLLRFGGNSLYEKRIYKQYKELLPPKEEFEFLSFTYTLITTLYDQTALKAFEFILKENRLTIKAEGSLYLVEERLKEIEKPKGLSLYLVDKKEIPPYPF